MKFTVNQFRNDEACLQYLFDLRLGSLTECPECAAEPKFSPVKDSRSFCGFQVYPTVNTVFHKTTTPLTYWFYAIYLFTNTRTGVAAKELDCQLEVCYKTAHRLANQIKKLMMDTDGAKLFGEVSYDESYFGMRGKNKHAAMKKHVNPVSNKTGVTDFMDNKGNVKTQVLGVETDPFEPLASVVMRNVSLDSILITDAYPPYKSFNKFYAPHVPLDHERKEYVKEGFTTNSVENYWSTLKRMIIGTHIYVIARHLPKCVAENTFPYVHRN